MRKKKEVFLMPWKHEKFLVTTIAVFSTKISLGIMLVNFILDGPNIRLYPFYRDCQRV